MFESQAERQIHQLLSAKLIEQNDFTVGKSQYEYYLNNLVEEEAKSAKEKGHPVSREVLKKRLGDSALRNIKLYHIEKAIVQAENIKVSDERLEEIAKKEAEKLNYDFEAILNIYKSNDNFKDSLVQDVLYEFLKANNKIVKTDKKQVPEEHDHE
jgi:FKBP-type peptidyl-prolyl cis-trans isomerase (trigger factor)